MMGEEYQPDVLHPAWAPGAVTPLPSYTPADYVQYTMQYGNAESNGDFFTSVQPRVSALQLPSWQGPAGGGQHGCPHTFTLSSSSPCRWTLFPSAPIPGWTALI